MPEVPPRLFSFARSFRDVFGDFGNGKIFGLTENPPGTFTSSELMSTGRNISSFGQDGAGELYVVDYSGSVLKIVAQ